MLKIVFVSSVTLSGSADANRLGITVETPSGLGNADGLLVGEILIPACFARWKKVFRVTPYPFAFRQLSYCLLQSVNE